MDKKIKVIFILIIITLALLAISGSLYFLTQNKIRIYYLRISEKYKIGTEEKIKEAIEEFRTLAEKYPKSRYAPKALYQIGYGYQLLYEKLKDDSKLDIAKDEYSRLVRKYPFTEESEKALLEIANIYYIKGSYNEAEAQLNYLLSQYPNTTYKSKIYTKKGYIYLALGEYEKALQSFSQPENTNNDEAMLGKAETYFKLGEYEKGINIYEEFIKYRKSSNLREKAINSFIENTYSYAKKLADNRDYHRSIIFYNKIIDLVPNSKYVENALYWIGENYYDLRDYRNAINYFQKVLANPGIEKDDSALIKIGVIYFEEQKFEEALKYFQRVINEYPNSKYLNIAKSWERQTLREIKYKR